MNLQKEGLPVGVSEEMVWKCVQRLFIVKPEGERGEKVVLHEPCSRGVAKTQRHLLQSLGRNRPRKEGAQYNTKVWEDFENFPKKTSAL